MSNMEELKAKHEVELARFMEEKAQWEAERDQRRVERERRDHEIEVMFERLEELDRLDEERRQRSIVAKIQAWYRRAFSG